MSPSVPSLRLERRISHDGLVSVGGNFYSVPDTTRRRVLKVQALDEIQIFETGRLIARHPVLKGRHQRSHATRTSRAPAAAVHTPDRADETSVISRAGEVVARRSLDLYDAVARQLAKCGAAGMTARAEPNSSLLDRIKQTLVGLRMPRALEMIDVTVQQLEGGELNPLEAIEGLLAEELSSFGAFYGVPLCTIHTSKLVAS